MDLGKRWSLSLWQERTGVVRKKYYWCLLKRLQVIDSTTITLFSNLIFKGVGRHPKTGKKKGGIKVHVNIHANEDVPSDIRFTSAATNDSFMLRPSNYTCGDIVALDRAYIDYAKFEELTRRGVIYVTKMKKSLAFDTVRVQTPSRYKYGVRLLPTCCSWSCRGALSEVGVFQISQRCSASCSCTMSTATRS